MKSRFLLEAIIGPRTLETAVQLTASVALYAKDRDPPLILVDNHPPYPQAILRVFGDIKHRRRKGGRGRFKYPRLKPPADLQVGVVKKPRDDGGNLLKVWTQALFCTKQAIEKRIQNWGSTTRSNLSYGTTQRHHIVRPDDTADEFFAVPEDAVRLGADAFAVVAFVRGKTEAAHLRRVAEFVRQAEAWDMPVVIHVYARKFSSSGQVEISTEPEDVAWAVRCGVEVGADVIKASYTGDVSSYSEIVRSCPVRLVAASGPTTETVRESLAMAAGVIAGGARGMTIGRNVWGVAHPEKALEAFKMIIHGGVSAAQALQQMGL